ncbi:hypothetical protein STEG23_021079, partial [Scotinomys teguina]
SKLPKCSVVCVLLRKKFLLGKKNGTNIHETNSQCTTSRKDETEYKSLALLPAPCDIELSLIFPRLMSPYKNEEGSGFAQGVTGTVLGGDKIIFLPVQQQQINLCGVAMLNPSYNYAFSTVKDMQLYRTISQNKILLGDDDDDSNCDDNSGDDNDDGYKYDDDDHDGDGFLLSVHKTADLWMLTLDKSIDVFGKFWYLLLSNHCSFGVGWFLVAAAAAAIVSVVSDSFTVAEFS